MASEIPGIPSGSHKSASFGRRNDSWSELEIPLFSIIRASKAWAPRSGASLSVDSAQRIPLAYGLEDR